MAFAVRVPTLGESVTEGVIARWAKAEGETVAPDDVLLELETDKASLEIAAERAGVLHIVKPQGATVTVGEVVAEIGDGAAAAAPPPAKPAPGPEPSAPPAPGLRAVGPLSPAVRRLVTEHGLDPAAISASGKGGRITKEDVLAHLERQAAPAAPLPGAPAAPPAPVGEGDEVVPMSRIRRRIAERLVQAQRTAAILTTFNEIDMAAVVALRARMRERFQRAHGIGLGFMSFFARSCVLALRDVPIVNAEIRGEDVVHHRAVHLGVAVGTERGLVVPVVRDAQRLSFAEIEREIARLAGLAREGKLVPDDLAGGTFTISNGGVYGSLLSTPILNPPQSGILGMHKIEKRAVVVGDQIVVRPMMYVALSYDHRLVDGEQAVTFLVRVKERIEEPERLLLEV
ncbi:MAG TPA: 2-oxoglutarate dehydrogenase complex dihydrolipoyllysine-residue succinyltransferase [Candidatus Binatia bacterium]|nr:2-oxoglutarate dehydrogenase complex dihydrolipoyllysine-residue succinyltransferase [Candidatus Binatia bacterium]